MKTQLTIWQKYRENTTTRKKMFPKLEIANNSFQVLECLC